MQSVETALEHLDHNNWTKKLNRSSDPQLLHILNNCHSERHQVNKAKLLRHIQNVFSTNQYPGDDNITYQSQLYIYSYERVRNIFRGKSWDNSSITLEFLIKEFQLEISFLSAAGFHYYFPAFLKHAVESPYESDDLIDILINMSTPHPVYEYKGHYEYHVEKFSLFRCQEIGVLVEFFYYIEHINQSRELLFENELENLKRAIEHWENHLKDNCD